MALNFPNSPSDGDTYEDFYWDATAGIWRRQLSVTNLDDLDDVSATSPSGDDILIYNNGTGNWESGNVDNIVTIPDPALSALTDTVIASPADGEVLKYDGTDWVNEQVAINTDGDPGGRIFVGSTDPNTSYTLAAGDVWIEV